MLDGAFEGSKLPAATIRLTDMNFGPLPMCNGLSRLGTRFLGNPSIIDTIRDVIGVELAGALKNVIALGAGFCDGLAIGDNAKGAFITRGLAEMSRLGVALGAQPVTFAGLAGIGDVIATCSSSLSRNHYVGEQLATGRTLEQISASMDNVAEGVNTTKAAFELSHYLNVEMPIVNVTYNVLFEGLSPKEAVSRLMERPVGFEQ